MIEPNMATMLVYILTDLAVPRGRAARDARARRGAQLQHHQHRQRHQHLGHRRAASPRAGCRAPTWAPSSRALLAVCRDLAEDVVRNGEGVRHVIRVAVRGAADAGFARALGKAIVNAPLFKCAVAGNDPNVGRLVQAIGKYVGAQASRPTCRACGCASAASRFSPTACSS